MAFKIWQIGLHLQQQEAVAVAIVRGAKECFLQRWWRLPLENDIIKDGRIVDAQQLAKTLLPWSRELPQRHHIMLAFPASRTLQRSFPRPSMSLGEREQTAAVRDDGPRAGYGSGLPALRLQRRLTQSRL
ncbi:hypothetical protein ECZU45_35980 [Escherichia coli]|nr:hypothetical protein ECZU45_35980 [Escherichia coli]